MAFHQIFLATLWVKVVLQSICYLYNTRLSTVLKWQIRLLILPWRLSLLRKARKTSLVGWENLLELYLGKVKKNPIKFVFQLIHSSLLNRIEDPGGKLIELYLGKIKKILSNLSFKQFIYSWNKKELELKSLVIWRFFFSIKFLWYLIFRSAMSLSPSSCN